MGRLGGGRAKSHSDGIHMYPWRMQADPSKKQLPDLIGKKEL